MSNYPTPSTVESLFVGNLSRGERMNTSIHQDGTLDDSRPPPDAAIEFDLQLESEEEKKSERSSFGPFVAAYAGMGGVFAVIGGLALLGVNDGFAGVAGIAALSIGLVVLITGALAIKKMGGGMAVRLRLDDTEMVFTRRNGTTLSVRWDDPGLRINLDHLAGDPDKALPRRDARYRRPYWIDVWTPKSRFYALETTLPEEAFVAVLERSRRKRVQVSQSRVAFYWHTAPKSPGWLDFDAEGKVGPGRELNGEVNRLRGPSAPREP
jgi:hypothetical protein